MAFEHYIRNGQKQLRLGYTSGTCAALATAGACQLLLTGEISEYLSVMTARGIEVTVCPENFGINNDSAWCAITKDGGDDVDITHGIKIYAKVERLYEPGIVIEGGEGIGRVTKPGLDQPVGNAAINSVPRKMITESIEKITKAAKYENGIKVTIYAPEGKKIAAKTFNPIMGIEGGISILGTSGIVVPMSKQALIDTIEIEIKQAACYGDRIILTPGNYGNDYIKKEGIVNDKIPIVTISNFLGDAIDIAVANGFKEIIIIAHIGKLVKVAAGVMMTHSSYADCRKEVFCSHSAIAGASMGLCREIMAAATTDRCIELLDKGGIRNEVMGSIMNSIENNISRRGGDGAKVGAVTFSNFYGTLGKTKKAGELIELWNEENTTA